MLAFNEAEVSSSSGREIINADTTAQFFDSTASANIVNVEMQATEQDPVINSDINNRLSSGRLLQRFTSDEAIKQFL